jgi:aminocarboxymuconate-semialdehyde decarboxylase
MQEVRMPSRRDFLNNLAGAITGILFVNCGLVTAGNSSVPVSAGEGKRRKAVVDGQRIITIDAHGHCFIPEIWPFIKDYKESQPLKQFLDEQQSRKLNLSTLEFRLRQMDEWGIDMQAVSIPPVYNYWADRDIARRIVRIQNEKIAEVCAAHPDRFVGIGTVAVQHPDLAVEQMEEGAKRLGLRGFVIGGSINGEELSAPKFHPFWAKAEELGTLVFIHPAGFAEGERRFQGKGRLDNVIGNPLETTVALSHLIFEGTLDLFPRLRILAAHGGGYLPSYSGRSDRCFGEPQSCKAGQKRPSEYLKQIYYDSLVFTNEGMRHMIAEVGASQIVLGTDYPFGWESDTVGHILGVPGLTSDQKRAILSGNAARLLRINL